MKEFDCCGHEVILLHEITRILISNGVEVNLYDLPRLHEKLSPDMKAYDMAHGINKVSALFYDNSISPRIYHSFVKHVVAAAFPYPFYFQATPTIRIHCPDSDNSEHYPRYHSDLAYGHPPGEINIWVPLTFPLEPQYHGFRVMNVDDSHEVMKAFYHDYNKLIAEATNDKAFNLALNQRAPQVQTPLGRFLAFDSRCLHTGEPLEKHTRISMDIRIIAVEDYNKLDKAYQGSGRRKVRYVPGEGYHALSSEGL